MDPVVCCLLGICCPPFTQEQQDKLAKLLVEHWSVDASAAPMVAEKMIQAHSASIEALKPIIKAARKHV